MKENLRIISIPLRGAYLNEEFTVTIKFKKKINTKKVFFMYCKFNHWFETEKIELTKQKENQKSNYDYFSGKIKFTENYTHYCHFQIIVEGIEKELIIKKEPETNEPFISKNGEGYHWDIFVNERIGKVASENKEKEFIQLQFEGIGSNIYCKWLNNKSLIGDEDNLIQGIDFIIGKMLILEEKNLLITYSDSITDEQKEKISDVFYKKRMYLDIEGIVVKEK